MAFLISFEEVGYRKIGRPQQVVDTVYEGMTERHEKGNRRTSKIDYTSVRRSELTLSDTLCSYQQLT